ncbi:MAG: ureidoglycolate lyase, partial [Ferrovibrionaceae bacterium]
MIELTPRPLTAQAFRPFGDVIAVDGRDHIEINEGMARRYHDLATVDVEAEGGRPLISIFRARPWFRPIRLRVMERHPLGSQAFVPMHGHPFLVVVAPPGPAPSPAA